ncbi:hypothetical protein [Paraclostridium bifermentans]|uniref:hypothetical protein n=1 Tax=Paraclostridium bifermentans TaxID=1490 RepID=UPI00374EE1DF
MAIKRLNLFDDEVIDKDYEPKVHTNKHYSEREEYYEDSPKYKEERQINRQPNHQYYEDDLYEEEIHTDRNYNNHEKHYNYYNKNNHENSRYTERNCKRFVERDEDTFDDFDDNYFANKTPSKIDNTDDGIKKRSLFSKLFLPVRFLRGGINGAVKVSKHVLTTLNEQSKPKNKSLGIKNKINKVGTSIGNGVKAFKQNTKAQVGLLLGLCGVAMIMVFMVLERG